jgi:hypothetical protein
LPILEARINPNNFGLLSKLILENRAGSSFQRIKSFLALIYQQYFNMVSQKSSKKGPSWIFWLKEPLLAAFFGPWWL